MDNVRYLNASEQGLVVEVGTQIDAGVNHRVHMLVRSLKLMVIPAITEIVPTYRSLLIYFDPLVISREDLRDIIKMILDKSQLNQDEGGQQGGRVVNIPVCYGGEYGPDLEFVASYNGLSTDEVIKVHTSTPYQVYMLGFTPGFPYLGGMSKTIAAPRLDKPRVVIPAGSVGIAETQTGFYPIDSPGGWRLIGKTPVRAFNPESKTPFLFNAGDYLQFQPISVEEFAKISQKVVDGNYTPEITSLQKR